MTDPISYLSTTPRLGLPLLFSGQSQKEVTVNEAILSTDLLLHGAIEAEAATPPTSPASGQVWLVGASPTGAWVGHTGHLAGWSEGGWRFIVPRDGMRLFDRSQNASRLYVGGWRLVAAPAAASGGTTVDAEARAVLATLLTRLKDAGILSTS